MRSTNPFDDGGGASAAQRHQHQHLPQQPPPYPFRHSDNTSTAGHYSTTPTTMMPQRHFHQSQQPHQQHFQQLQQQVASTSSSPPIFSARGVEWPLPTTFNPNQYRKFRRESRALGHSLGIMNSGLRIGSGDATGGGGVNYSMGSAFASDNNSTSGASGVVGGGRPPLSSSGDVAGGGGGGSVGSGGGGSLDSPYTGGGGGGGGGGGYGGLTGLMGRVLGASSHPASGSMQGASFLNDIEEADLASSTTRIVLPPHAHCVAAANGWIVAVVECSPPSTTTSSSSTHSGKFSSPNNVMMQQPQSKQSWTQFIPPLRMVSRWNVRRGSTMLGSDGNHLVPLPPPVRPTLSEDMDATTPRGGSSHNYPNFGRIEHTFVDPTGCHILLSAQNGEAYYLHSTSKSVVKLNGFGPSVDGSYSGFRPGSTLAEVAVGGGDSAGVVQVGITPGSYVTAVGWDRERGTEGSTKRILLGTSLGELYEYSLHSPLSSPAKAKSSAFDAKAGEIIAMMEDGDNDPMESPILLHRLVATGMSSGSAGRGNTVASRGLGGDVGAVGGILFQRVMGGIGVAGSGLGSGGCVVVLVSTGGLHRHTRLHTFRSEPSASSSLSVRSAFAHPTNLATKCRSNSRSFELPGSVEFAEICSCNDESFALRTETGIYFGTTERSGGIAALGGAAGGVVGTGMLTYASLANFDGTGSGVMTTTPTSVALTPHHFVTLSSNNNVRFINRVAKKIIQEERVDWISVTQNSSADIDVQYGTGSSRESSVLVAELITDIRRPDQIWLRRGRSLVHISSSNENRDVWKYTLTRCIETTIARASDGTGGNAANAPMTSEEKEIESRFEDAKSLCSNPSQKAVVNAARAEYHFLQGRVELAAKYMAQCPSVIMPFAETSTRLSLPMIAGDMNNENISPQNNSRLANEALRASNLALITYLSDKMKASKSNHDSVVCTILGTWLTELHLQEREKWADQHGKGQPQTANHALLHQFLSAYVRDMDPKSIINVLASHDMNAVEGAGYSAAAGDISAAVNAALSVEDEKNGALDALRVLNDSPLELAEPYYYKYALTLLSRSPMSAAKSFVARYGEGLSDMKLLPALMHYEQRRRSNASFLKSKDIDSGAASPYPTLVDDPNASITYLEGVIKLGSKSPAIYNYLIALYASIEDEGPLFRFLSTHVPPATSSTSSIDTGSIDELLLKQANDEKKTPLDKSYALRAILRTGRHFRSAVKLYMGYGMRQQAVELALKVDPSLARELARQSDDRDETKRLWLMIARNAAANGSSSRDGKEIVARVVKVLKDCGPDILSIEDVLPFLPDFAQIDQFKDEICEALTSYSTKIEHYLKEMNECDQTCDALRDELGRLKTTGTQVRADARCALTNKPILDQSQPFYIFPSGYAVLETALKREVIPYLNEKQRDRVKFVENELSRLRKSRTSCNQSSCEIAMYDYEMEQLTVELGGLIAAECPLTGTVMVESIDRGFSSDEDD